LHNESCEPIIVDRISMEDNQFTTDSFFLTYPSQITVPMPLQHGCGEHVTGYRLWLSQTMYVRRVSRLIRVQPWEEGFARELTRTDSGNLNLDLKRNRPWWLLIQYLRHK
jgi:hypothetical protein